MKKLLSIALMPLLLAGCSTKPDAVEYKSPGQWDKAISKTDIVCDRNEWREHNTLQAKELADCYDSHGAATRRLIFANEDRKVDRIQDIVENDWIAEIPAVVSGPNWMVECSSVDECKAWEKGIGGELIETEEFIP